MKVVYNDIHTNFILPKEFLNKHPEYDEMYGDLKVRTHPDLVEFVEKTCEKEGACIIYYGSGFHADLCVADLPDEATDFCIKEGSDEYHEETIYYVVDGKIKEY